MNVKGAVRHILTRLKKELAPTLIYHDFSHTIRVIRSAHAIALAENLNAADAEILFVAAAYHDSGFLIDHSGNEESSNIILRECLPQFGFPPEKIRYIESLINCTAIPQTPIDKVSEILCDADLLYLAGNSYYRHANRLREEWALRGQILTDKQWLNIQINFLKTHRFFTDAVKNRFQNSKHERLAQLLEEFRQME